MNTPKQPDLDWHREDDRQFYSEKRRRQEDRMLPVPDPPKPKPEPEHTHWYTEAQVDKPFESPWLIDRGWQGERQTTRRAPSRWEWYTDGPSCAFCRVWDGDKFCTLYFWRNLSGEWEWNPGSRNTEWVRVVARGGESLTPSSCDCKK